VAADRREGRDGERTKKRLTALADFWLGYETSAAPGVVRKGPQPIEGIESVLLQEFPSYTLEALRAADWLALERILDYRRAQAAIDLFNDGSKGLAALRERPDLTAILLEMGRAQAGAGLTLDHMLAVKAAERDEDDD